MDHRPLRYTGPSEVLHYCMSSSCSDLGMRKAEFISVTAMLLPRPLPAYNMGRGALYWGGADQIGG